MNSPILLTVKQGKNFASRLIDPDGPAYLLWQAAAGLDRALLREAGKVLPTREWTITDSIFHDLEPDAS